jgi:CDP-glucose 4,6-dehydratase
VEVEEIHKIFKGKRVFITGHTGFKGSWLVNILSGFGSEIMGLALPSQNKKDIFQCTDTKKLCKTIYADIRNVETLEHEILDFKPDFLFHMAAQPLVRESYQKPLDTYSINVQGTANILEVLRKIDWPCVSVMITTDKVYHNLENGHHYSENDRIGGFDPYSASKGCAELVIDSYRNSFFLQRERSSFCSISVARAGNVIGGGDWSKDRIIPDIVSALSAKKAITLRNPNSTRPWQHVLEPLIGYVTLAAYQKKESLKYATAFNFGPAKNDQLSVLQLAELAIETWGSGRISIETDVTLHEAQLLNLNIQKAEELLGWKPKLTSKEAVQWTIEWYKLSESDPGALFQFTIEQINNYLKR